MKTLTKLLTVLAIAALGQSAHGISYLYQDVRDGNVDGYIDQEFWRGSAYSQRDPLLIDASLQGSFDITNVDTNNGGEGIDRKGYSKITDIITDIEVLFVISGQVLDLKMGVYEDESEDFDSLLGAGYTYGFNFSGSEIAGSLLLNLVDTGILNWTLTTESDEAYLLGGSLAVQTRPVSDSGATLGLLAVGLFGIVSLKRRLS